MASTSDESSAGRKRSVPKKTSVQSAGKITGKAYKNLMNMLTSQPFSLSTLLVYLDKDASIFKSSLVNLTENDIDDLLQHLPIKAYKIYSTSK